MPGCCGDTDRLRDEIHPRQVNNECRFSTVLFRRDFFLYKATCSALILKTSSPIIYVTSSENNETIAWERVNISLFYKHKWQMFHHNWLPRISILTHELNCLNLLQTSHQMAQPWVLSSPGVKGMRLIPQQADDVLRGISLQCGGSASPNQLEMNSQGTCKPKDPLIGLNLLKTKLIHNSNHNQLMFQSVRIVSMHQAKRRLVIISNSK